MAQVQSLGKQKVGPSGVPSSFSIFCLSDYAERLRNIENLLAHNTNLKSSGVANGEDTTELSNLP